MKRHLRLVEAPAPRKRPAQLTFGFGAPDDAASDEVARELPRHHGLDDGTAARLKALRLKLIKRGGIG